MKNLIFTRYLYFKTEVINSLHWSLLENQYEESLYWTYEIYFSGFQEEIFSFTKEFYRRYIKELFPHYEVHIDKMHQEWTKAKNNHCIIGTIVKLLSNSKKSITNSLRIRQNIKTTDAIISNMPFEIKHLSPEDIHKYHTLKLTKKMRNWSFLDNVACKYYIRRLMCSDLDIAYPYVESINFDDWLYYASFTPIWKQRIVKFNGKVDYNEHTVSFDNEEFYNIYDYEPDEQSKELKTMLWSNGLESYVNLSISEFSKKYGCDNIYKKHTILLSKQNT